MATKTRSQIDDEVEAIGHPDVECREQIDVFLMGSDKPCKARVESIHHSLSASPPVTVLVRHRVQWDRERYCWVEVDG